MSHYEITLSETEQKVAEYIAKKRYESARKMGIPNNRTIIGTLRIPPPTPTIPLASPATNGTGSAIARFTQ